MHKRTSKPTQTRRLAWTGLVTLTVLITLLITVPSVPIAHAQEPEPTTTPGADSKVPPPPGDCWNGVLSDEPLHCHILEEAQRAGHIEVVAMYLVHEMRFFYKAPLHIYLRQAEPLSSEVGDFLRDKAYEYIEIPEAREHYGYACMPIVIKVIPAPEAPEDCPERHLQRAGWQDFHFLGNGALPRPFAYPDIVIEPGGADARRSRSGWASWTQVWPAPTGGRGASGASSGFDVSDVDLTNIPDPDCDEEFDNFLMLDSCLTWKEFPTLGIAGARWDRVNTTYIQVKNAPDDEAELEALKQQLVPNYQDYGNEVEIISVKYDFGELWKWSVILDRFTFSASNTISIVRGQVDVNSPYIGPHVLWMNGVEPAGYDEWDAQLDGEELREILIVWAYDHELAVDALPELLPELGIPVDAVGLVARTYAATRIEKSLASADVSESTVTVSNSPSEATGEKVAPDPDANSESEPRTVPAAAPAESNGPAVKAKTDETNSQSESQTDSALAQTPKTSETDLNNETTPDQQSISAATSGDQANSEPIAKTSSETDRSDTRELNQQTAGDVTSSRSANPPWLLMSVAGVLVLAVLGAAIFAILRLRLRRA